MSHFNGNRNLKVWPRQHRCLIARRATAARPSDRPPLQV